MCRPGDPLTLEAVKVISESSIAKNLLSLLWHNPNFLQLKTLTIYVKDAVLSLLLYATRLVYDRSKSEKEKNNYIIAVS